ncbi:MAG: patatin-like phospholipase family protein [Actinobacteria bacterium]|nr:patatin-like phospholipase family protein [Actinomycetota bacterium]
MSLANLPRPTIFVFGGGGSRGAAHAGTMRALTEAGVYPDAVIGTSVGSISAAVAAEYPGGAADKLLAVWREIQKKDAFPGNPVDIMTTLRRSRRYLYSSEALRTTLRKYLSAVRIEDLALPYGAVTTDYRRATAKLLRSGSLVNAIVASAAIPTVYPMVEIDNEMLCDGGVVANVPALEALSFQPASMVVLDCIGPVNAIDNGIVDIAMGAASIMMHKQRVADLTQAAKDVPVVYMPPPSSVGSVFDFSHTDELIEDTYSTGREFLKRLELPTVATPGLYGELPSGWDDPDRAGDDEPTSDSRMREPKQPKRQGTW